MNRGLFLLLLLLTELSFSSTLNACLTQAYKSDHRLNRIDATQVCFESNKKSLTIELCYKSIDQLKIHPKSAFLNEHLRSVCFYEVHPFKNIKTCIQRAKTFELAANRDEGIFECYRQFQNTLNRKQCLQVSQHMTYPLKKDYLANHCLTNVD